MSGYTSNPSGSYGETTEAQRQFDDYQRTMSQVPPQPPAGMTMGQVAPADYFHQHHRAASVSSGSSPPTHPYVPQNYNPAMTHPPPPMTSSPLMMAQGMQTFSQLPSAHQGLPPPILPYGGLPPSYAPHYPMPPSTATGYAYPPASLPHASAHHPATSTAPLTTSNAITPSDNAGTVYSHSEPLTHTRAPKSTTTMEQIQIMQEAFKREQDTSRRRYQSSYAEAAARRAARMGVIHTKYEEPYKMPPQQNMQQSSASPSPTSSAGSMQGSVSSHQNLLSHGQEQTIVFGKTRLPTIVTKRKDAAILDQDEQGRDIVKYKDSESVFYIGSVPLGVDDDKYWLSELQVYLRANFAEAFSASEEDIAVLMHGRNKPISLGQIGIRCCWCKTDNPAERGQQATSYPSQISGIYNSVQQMLRLHLDCCVSMPPDVRERIEFLKVSCSSRGGRKQYWIDAAKRIGLIDTPSGIRFGRYPGDPLPPLTGPSVATREAIPFRKKRSNGAPLLASSAMKKSITGQGKGRPMALEEDAEEEYAHLDMPTQPPPDAAPLVFPEDKPLISDHLYLTLEQMAPCTLMEADRVGCYKTRKVGFPGIACRHCVGQAGCGRYFPATEASLSQTTTSQTIMNHVRNCRRCPTHIRDELEIMKRERTGPDGKKLEKPKHGGRKVFFHRLWCRIQGLEIDEEVDLAGEPKSRKQKARRQSEGNDDDMHSAHESEHATDDHEVSSSEKARGRRSSGAVKIAPWIHGCVRLTKADDHHWLSEMECFARSELVEVFTYRYNFSLTGYGGRKLPSEGQVGVRCVYCKDLEPDDRPNGCVHFPDSIVSLHSKVSDMVRLHFPSCPSLPDRVRQRFKSLRGFDAKVSTDDSYHYWIDAASDIGLSNLSTGGSDTWGITFRRDPLEPSPADELDLEAKRNDWNYGAAGNILVNADDRGACTDQVLLLMRQVQPCRFGNSDKGSMSGSRARSM